MTNLEIIIPCYNEGGNLMRLWSDCLEIVEDSESEIFFVIVDNGSTDETYKFIERHENQNKNIRFVSLPKNLGYGGGIIQGLKSTSSQYVGWTHADLQTPLSDCVMGKYLLDNGCDFVKGVRSGRSIIDKFFSLSMGFLSSAIFKSRLYEVNAQPTLLTRDFFDSWSNPPHDFSLDLYALVQARRAGLQIGRFKVKFLKRMHGESKWNSGFTSRLKFIIRTLIFCRTLRKSIK